MSPFFPLGAEVFGEIKNARLDVEPVAGEEVDRIINDAFKLDAALPGKLKEVWAWGQVWG